MTLKAGIWIFWVVGAFVFVLDPTVQVALIVSIPGTIAAIGTFVIGVRNSRKLSVVAKNVDGINSRLSTELTEKSNQLVNTQGELSHAKGVKEGSDRERDKQAQP